MELLISVKPEAGGEARNVRLEVADQLVLGRGPESPIPLDGSALSRDHLAFTVENGTLYVKDLSSNGTWLNGSRLSRDRPLQLRAGDTVRISGYEFDIDFASPAAPEPSVNPPDSEVPLPEAPANPLASALTPVGRYWDGFTGLEKLLIFVAAACLALVLMYLQVS